MEKDRKIVFQILGFYSLLRFEMMTASHFITPKAFYVHSFLENGYLRNETSTRLLAQVRESQGSYSGRDKERFTSGGRLRKSYEYVILDIEHTRSILARPHLGIRNTSTCTRGYRHSFRRTARRQNSEGEREGER